MARKTKEQPHPVEGLTKCIDCGCKYWDETPTEKEWRCHSCFRLYVPSMGQ